MIPEQKQRIQQIERWINRRTMQNCDPYADLRRALSEIDFLLSLVESQEAPITSLKDLHDSDCLYVTHNGACDCVDGVVVNRAAILMRSRCVEKLRSLARERVNQSNPNHEDHEYDQAVAHVLLQAADELESVSIEGQEKL